MISTQKIGSPINIQKTIQLTRNMKLIDINSDDVLNFDCKFDIKSSHPFELAYVDQNTLDNGDEIQYKDSVNNNISGTINESRNIKTSYYFVLRSKSDEENNATVNLEIQPLNVIIPPEQDEETSEEYTPDNIQTKWDIKKIFIWGIIIITILYIVYYLYNSYKKNHVLHVQQSPIPIPDVSPPVIEINNIPDNNILPPNTDIKFNSFSPQQSLLSKIKALNANK